MQKQARGSLRESGAFLGFKLKIKKNFKKENYIFSDLSTPGTKQNGQNKGKESVHTRITIVPWPRQAKEGYGAKEKGQETAVFAGEGSAGYPGSKKQGHDIGGGCQTLQGSKNHHLRQNQVSKIQADTGAPY
jgi:hypothetical protein